MSHSSQSFKWFDPEAMPDHLPVFPLAGVVLLPNARLPLNVFEPRYLNMVQDVLGTPGRLLGIIQPSEAETPANPQPALYRVGCVGRITSFNETEDGRFLISLTGVCRFVMQEEYALSQPYRVVRPDWSSYADDFEESPEDDVDREKLVNALKRYFKLHDIGADWNIVQNTPTEPLVASLVMISPLSPSEKQALLECPSLHSRAEMLTTLMEMAAIAQGDGEGDVRH